MTVRGGYERWLASIARGSIQHCHSTRRHQRCFPPAEDVGTQTPEKRRICDFARRQNRRVRCACRPSSSGGKDRRFLKKSGLYNACRVTLFFFSRPSLSVSLSLPLCLFASNVGIEPFHDDSWIAARLVRSGQIHTTCLRSRTCRLPSKRLFFMKLPSAT